MLAAFDLTPFRRAVDLGGATGAFMIQLAAIHPGCHCTVVDLPNVISAGQLGIIAHRGQAANRLSNKHSRHGLSTGSCLTKALHTLCPLPLAFAAVKHFTKAPFVTDPEVLGRVSWVAADFFYDGDDDVSAAVTGEAEERAEGRAYRRTVPDADLYIMTRILHDW